MLLEALQVAYPLSLNTAFRYLTIAGSSSTIKIFLGMAFLSFGRIERFAHNSVLFVICYLLLDFDI
jgi:hypothetical protein